MSERLPSLQGDDDEVPHVRLSFGSSAAAVSRPSHCNRPQCRPDGLDAGPNAGDCELGARQNRVRCCGAERRDDDSSRRPQRKRFADFGHDLSDSQRDRETRLRPVPSACRCVVRGRQRSRDDWRVRLLPVPSLLKVSILPTVSTIGEQAFSMCPALTAVTFEDEVASVVTTIGEGVFYKCTTIGE